MKKIIAITFMISLFAGTAFAAAPTGSEYTNEITGGTPSETISVLSNNVGAIVVSSPTAYAATTAHLNGSKQFGSSSESTKLFSATFEEGTTDVLLTPSDSESTDFNDASVWKAL